MKCNIISYNQYDEWGYAHQVRYPNQSLAIVILTIMLIGIYFVLWLPQVILYTAVFGT